MPALSYHRQPDLRHRPGLDWFGGASGLALLAAEQLAIKRVLAGCPALPWAWFGVDAADPPTGNRGVLLHRGGPGWTGAMRCRLPLPLASESFGLVLIQHVLDADDDHHGLLEECARILAPGGVLWLAALNPWTPYRARWARTGLRSHDAGRWQAELQRAGFPAGSVSLQWLGPHWEVGPGSVGVGATDRFRAGIALTINKRVLAAQPPALLRSLRWQAGSPGVARQSVTSRRKLPPR